MGHTAPRGGSCLTVSALVFTAEDEPRVLLHQHKRYPVVIPPGGHVEADEHPWQAVLRELGEETGVIPEQLSALLALECVAGPGRFPAPVALDVHEVEPGWTHTDLAFAFVIDGAPQLAPREGESVELCWMTAAEVGRTSQVPPRIAELVGRLAPLVAVWPRLPAAEVGMVARAFPQFG
ncbi:NUDIX domain-containing protein [Propionicimonas sp.]|uniref:NUDIX domain-containing protein n=1 Tax=Propionicimonas sp. TaxID=1955623 RepID=UPI00184451F3|nr:NUDIX domain-containing protein [Propionicimonas sp.]MBU3975771.1 NUDIX domain-containing protein [Actinomycetota bacterium]MBA3022239.1 NUDIX domain-containing protein [Propionicimonas sp.]MBU3987661.1 NUDIX domain-containing protein [Actinomycetota bacterium]MBU4007695.1 NUDIX domain-containing protein [Actinomycetota bacterium]MBU4065339.1 NUDIX domain-containing protein [Actinomycetota bacterium]